MENLKDEELDNELTKSSSSSSNICGATMQQSAGKIANKTWKEEQDTVKKGTKISGT